MCGGWAGQRVFLFSDAAEAIGGRQPKKYISAGDGHITGGTQGPAGEAMHLVIFGLTVSSSWGNGHATLWRSLIKAMLRRGHTVSFYEKDVSYYASYRDLHRLPAGGRLILYQELGEIAGQVRRDLSDADLALCTSYCPDGVAASSLILESGAGIKAFYDLDTPVTLSALSDKGSVEYLPPAGLSEFDLVLSYTGGRALEELRTRLGARVVAPLY